MFLPAADIILCREYPKDSTKKKNTLELENNFGEVAECKITMQKSVAFIDTNSEVSEREIKKAIPFTTA